jgi:response regulator RpfG family c-di-GMP phosphodiesterase
MNLQEGIINDNPVAVFPHQFLIRQSGLTIDQKRFRNGQKALDDLDVRDHSNKPCLLWSDINMSQMNDWEFLDALSLWPYADFIFVITVSSSVDYSDCEKTEHFRCVIGYLEKPIDAMLSMTLNHPADIPYLMKHD